MFLTELVTFPPTNFAVLFNTVTAVDTAFPPLLNVFLLLLLLLKPLELLEPLDNLADPELEPPELFELDAFALDNAYYFSHLACS
jgi:hypothetical protein